MVLIAVRIDCFASARVQRAFDGSSYVTPKLDDAALVLLLELLEAFNGAGDQKSPVPLRKNLRVRSAEVAGMPAKTSPPTPL